MEFQFLTTLTIQRNKQVVVSSLILRIDERN